VQRVSGPTLPPDEVVPEEAGWLDGRGRCWASGRWWLVSVEARPNQFQNEVRSEETLGSWVWGASGRGAARRA
jgi:hypothetical protein